MLCFILEGSDRIMMIGLILVVMVGIGIVCCFILNVWKIISVGFVIFMVLKGYCKFVISLVYVLLY